MGWFRKRAAEVPSWEVEVKDEILGTLVRPAESRWWTASVTTDAGLVTFKIGGEHRPDEQLIEHARNLVRSFGSFREAVKTFLQDEAKRLPKYRGEIEQLQIEDVSLFWPDRVNDGMIFFRGPADERRSWRCDYVGRRPVELGFDT